MWKRKIMLLVGMVTSLSLALFYPDETVGEIGETRVVHFPSDKSIGLLYAVDREFRIDPTWQWLFNWEPEFLGEARGDVAVPVDKMLRLDVTEDAWKGGSALADLRPDDIQMLSFRLFPGVEDRMLEDVAHLTGLEVLAIAWCEGLTGEGLKYVGNLNKLKYLYLPGHIPSDNLAHLQGIPSLHFLHMGGPMITDDKMVHIGKLTSLRELSLVQCDVGRGLEHLKNLRSLEYLNLRGDSDYYIDEGLAHLAGLAELRQLDIRQTGLSDAGLAHIGKMTNLEDLNIADCAITNVGMAHLVGLRRLKKLDISSNPVDLSKVNDIGLTYFTGLTSLEELKLPYAGITDTGLAQLSGLHSLRKLTCYSRHMTDRGLVTIAGLRSLADLVICADNITDSGIESLSRCTSLKKLDLHECPKITNAGIAHLENLKSLEKLWMSNLRVTGEGLAVLKGLRSLKDFRIDFLALGETGILHLKGLTTLERVSINYTGINFGNKQLALLGDLTNLKALELHMPAEDVTDPFTDEGFAHLANLKALEDLRITDIRNITDNDLRHLSSLTVLEHINLFNARKLTNTGLKYLEGLRRLRWVRLEDSGVTEAGLAQLKKKNPQLMHSL